MLKIPDIRALDAIAAAVDCPDEFSTRPTTCYGRGKCALSQLKHEDYHILKRSESCASGHVILRKSTDRDGLRCTSDDSLCENGTRQNWSSPLWFHQQFVPDLDRFEFRVFIKNNGKGGEVFHTIWTSSSPLERGVPEARNTIVAVSLGSPFLTALSREMKETSKSWYRTLASWPASQSDRIACMRLAGRK